MLGDLAIKLEKLVKDRGAKYQTITIDDIWNYLSSIDTELNDKEIDELLNFLQSKGVIFEEDEDLSIDLNYDSSGDIGINYYLNAIKEIPVLTREKEVRYFKEYKRLSNDDRLIRYKKAESVLIDQGLRVNRENISHLLETTVDEVIKIENDLKRLVELRNYILTHNLRLVVSIACKYLYRGVDLEDLIQEGNCALIHAINKFDCDKGFKFSTYSVPWIKLYLNRIISEQSRSIKVPIHISEAWAKIRQAENILLQKHSREPSIADIADYLNWPVKKITNILKAKQPIVSLETSLDSSDNNKTLLVDTIKDDSIEIEDRYVNDGIIEILNTMEKIKPRLALILQLRYGYPTRYKSLKAVPRTLEQVGIILSILEDQNVCMERIRQLEVRARKIFVRCAEKLGIHFSADDFQ